jgi:hypothetical protein
MPHRKLSDTEGWQAIGFIKTGVIKGRLAKITMNLLTHDFDFAIQWPAGAQYLMVSDVAFLC